MGTMKTLAQRITHIRKSMELTQEAFGERVGTTKQTVSQWEDGNILTLKASTVLNIAEASSFAPRWIESGVGPMFPRSYAGGPDILPVPLISWVQAGHWNEIQDNYQIGEGEKPVYTSRKVGPHAYALRVVGDSMENPNGRPTYPQGSIIIVDPDRQPVHGSCVIVRLDDEKRATFKQLIIDGDTRYLKPLNPRYPILKILGAATITGVAVQTITDED